MKYSGNKSTNLNRTFCRCQAQEVIWQLVSAWALWEPTVVRRLSATVAYGRKKAERVERQSKVVGTGKDVVEVGTGKVTGKWEVELMPVG